MNKYLFLTIAEQLDKALLLLVLVLSACNQQGTSSTTATAPYPTLDPANVSLGRQVYVANCASCHGQNAEGAPNWATPGPDGLYPAPPHNDVGHTWHHSDRALYETIRDGMNDPLRPGSPLRMPAFAGKLSDADIRAVIAYFKSLWTDDHKQWQREQTVKDFKPTPTASP